MTKCRNCIEFNMTKCYCLNMENIKKFRSEREMTQQQIADILCVSLRTYQRYEEGKISPQKEQMFIHLLKNAFVIDEEHGVLSIEVIRKEITPILEKHNISLCYLFGSYSRGEANEKSDVDLLIDTDIEGLKFFSFVEEIRQALKKKVDVITSTQLASSPELMRNILKEGVKICDK